MAAFLPNWGLTAADENAIIDSILARVTDKLSTYVQAHGLNGDFGHTGIPGQFDIEIRNSRDDRDEFGKNPFVSRVVVGGVLDPAFTDLLFGLAQDIDVGNFKTDDEAVASVDWIEAALANIPIQPPKTKIDFIGEALSILVVHEFGHIAGCFHTDQSPTDLFAGKPNLMDPYIVATNGPDFIYGTADDIHLRFGVDKYSSAEPFRGIDDTLNTIAFGLSTGKGSVAECGLRQGGNLTALTLPADALFALFAATEEDAWTDTINLSRGRRNKA
jgi:hypothetical protein